MERHRFEALDSLRGICAIAVALYHLDVTSIGTHWWAIKGAWMFVDFFFVLSGFVIAWNYGERLAQGYSVPAFMSLRLGRVYPLYAAILVAMVAVELLAAVLAHHGMFHREAFSGSRTLPALAGSLATIQIFGIWSNLVWNGPSWSLAAEIWAYAVFAGVCVLARERYVGVMGLISVVCALWLLTVGGSIDHTYAMALPRCLYGFGIGVLAARLRPSQGGSTSLEVLIAAACVVFVIFAKGPTTALAPLLFGITVVLFSLEGGAVSEVLKLPLLRWIGGLSYSIYMIHVFVLSRMTDVGGLLNRHLHVMVVCPGTARLDCFNLHGANALTVPAVFLAITVAGAWATFNLIEEPGRVLTRRWVKGGMRLPMRQGHLAADIAQP